MGMSRYRVVSMLPTPNLQRASSELRSALRRRMTDGLGEAPDWTTFRIIGPFETFDSRGGICYEYQASVARTTRALVKDAS